METGGNGVLRRGHGRMEGSCWTSLGHVSGTKKWNKVPGGDWVTNRAGRTGQGLNKLSKAKGRFT